MGFTKKNDAVCFSYSGDDLLQACKLQTSYLSRRIKDQEGNYAGDYLVLTEDEEVAFRECLAVAVNELWGMVSKMCPAQDNAFGMEEEVFLCVKDGGCDAVALAVVDGTLRDVLVYGVLKGWMTLCGEERLAEWCAQMFRDRLARLWKDMFRLRNRVELE